MAAAASNGPRKSRTSAGRRAAHDARRPVPESHHTRHGAQPNRRSSDDTQNSSSNNRGRINKNRTALPARVYREQAHLSILLRSSVIVDGQRMPVSVGVDIGVHDDVKHIHDFHLLKCVRHPSQEGWNIFLIFARGI